MPRCNLEESFVLLPSTMEEIKELQEKIKTTERTVNDLETALAEAKATLRGQRRVMIEAMGQMEE